MELALTSTIYLKLCWYQIIELLVSVEFIGEQTYLLVLNLI